MNAATAKPKIIIICGPTGIGKTTVAVNLAQHFGGEIVGADSMQVYKYMDIGTAKPTAAEQARVVHL
jgi:tRNA dimethylallyltransferase